MVGIGTPANEAQDAAPDSAASLAMKFEHDKKQLLALIKELEHYEGQFLANEEIDMAGLPQLRSQVLDTMGSLAQGTALAAAKYKKSQKLQELAAEQKSLLDTITSIYGPLNKLDPGPFKSADKRDSEAPGQQGN